MHCGGPQGPRRSEAVRFRQVADPWNTDFIAQLFCLPQREDKLYQSCLTSTLLEHKTHTVVCTNWRGSQKSAIPGGALWRHQEEPAKIFYPYETDFIRGHGGTPGAIKGQGSGGRVGGWSALKETRGHRGGSKTIPSHPGGGEGGRMPPKLVNGSAGRQHVWVEKI